MTITCSGRPITEVFELDDPERLFDGMFGSFVQVESISADYCQLCFSM